jgi:sugar transferase EpsL
VRPGITGWAQVNGRNSVGWSERFELDVQYVERYSIVMDARILLLTALKVFRREGINQQGSATMEKFRGNAA